MDVSRFFAPFEKITSGCFEVVPSLVAGQGGGVEIFEHLGCQIGLYNIVDERASWPDVLKHHWVSFLVRSKRFNIEININSSGESVSNNESRTSQVVTLGKRMDTSFEVTVS